MAFTVYILWSPSRDRFYVGHCQDIEARLENHNAGRNRSTQSGIPWTLMRTEQFSSRQLAVRRERQLKSWKSAHALRRLIETP